MASKKKAVVITAEDIKEVVDVLDQSLTQMRKIIESIDSLKECALELGSASTQRQKRMVFKVIFSEFRKLQESGTPIPLEDLDEMEREVLQELQQ